MLGRSSLVLIAVTLGGLLACTKTEGDGASSSTSATGSAPAASAATAPAAASASAAAAAPASASASPAASADAPAASGSAAAAASAPAAKAATSAVASAAASAAPADCGEKGQPTCPLQGWMKANMTPAVSASDTAALAVALEKTVAFAPPGYTNWASISKDGAKAAKAGDLAAAKQSCRTCHDQYKAKYKSEMRARKI